MTAAAVPKMPKRFVELSSVRLANDSINYAVERGYPSLIHGPAGFGKSVALYHLCQKHGHIYCSVNETAKNVRGLYLLLLQVFNVYCPSFRPTTSMVADAVYEGLKDRHLNRPRMALVVDEIGELNLAAQKELLRLHEATGMPLILSGNDVRLMQTNSRNAGLDQIVTRIGWRCEFEGLVPRDCVDLGVTFNVEGTDAYDALHAFGATRSLRDLHKLLDNAEHATGGKGSIRLHHLKAAVAELFGGRDGLRLLTSNNQRRVAGSN